LALAQTPRELTEMEERFDQMDFHEFLSQMTAAYPVLMRPLVTPLFSAIGAGDLTASGRMLIRRSVLQAACVGLELILLTIIIGKVAFAIGN
jgi:hypothetical protein